MTESSSPDAASVTGRSETHLCTSAQADQLGASIHRDVLEPYAQLKGEAERAGFDLRIDSGFRSFARQSSIWNRKATGKRAVLDSQAVPLDLTELTERDLVYAILRWSALPGASRHHWGTDLDVYDERTRPEGYEVDLIPEEVDAGGMFAPLHEWLDERIAAGTSYGFFRPYDQDRGGVAPERWHLSHGPVAQRCERVFTVDILRDTVGASDLELKGTILEHLDDIYERFVININRTFT
jgi:LAS superfamily LD-carboxypeptidase LdcB